MWSPTACGCHKDDPGNLLPSINETIARVLEDGTMDSFIAEGQRAQRPGPGGLIFPIFLNDAYRGKLVYPAFHGLILFP